ncbi:MAG TPA: LEPR-XLL domain-containing protein, partial [Roseateles sp.]
MSKKSNKRPSKPAHKPVIETLEPRLLLSATPLPEPSFGTTLSYSAQAATQGVDATLEIVNNGPQLTLQLRSGDQILASEALDENLRVSFTGSAFSDHLTLKLDGNTSPFSIKVDFDGGTDVPGLSDDQLVVEGSDAANLFITSSDDVLVKGSLDIAGDLDLQSAERIDVQAGASIQAGNDIRLAALHTAKAGVLGTDIHAVADAQVNLLGATLTGRNISLDAEASVALDSKDHELFGKQLKLGAVDAQANAAIALTGANAVNARGTLAIDASAKVDTQLASAPDDSSKNTAKDAAVAITHVDSKAKVRVAGTSALNAAGALSIASHNAVTAKTTADGGAGAAAGDAKGAVLAASYIQGDTRTELADGASLSGASITLTADATRSAEVVAKATKGGATQSADGSNDSEKKLAEQDAKTADGSLQFAAAVAIAATDGQSQVLLGSSGALTATDAAGAIAINAGMALTGPEGGLTAVADGSNKDAGDTGIGAAAAINTANVASRVTLAGSSAFSAAGGVNATATATSARFGAQAASGASGAGLGVAGSLAINVGQVKAESVIAAGASITVAEGTTLTLKAQTTTSDTAKAGAQASGDGMGASVAINIADTVARAAVETGASASGAGSLKLDAQSGNTVATEAKGGSEGGNAMTPIAALTIAHHDTLAELRGGDAALALKDVSLTAVHEGQVDTTADGTVAGEKSGLGMAFASGIVVDNTRARLDRALTLGGALDLAATGKQTTNTSAKGSAKGGKSADKAAEGDVDKQKAAQRSAADTAAADKGARSSADAGEMPKAETPTGNGDTGGADSSAAATAGALALNIAKSHVDAGITAGQHAQAVGTATITAKAEAHSAAVADASATVQTDGEGAGVAIALNVGSTEANAFMAGELAAQALSLTAGTPDDAKNTSKAQATAGAGGGKSGAAGALAINAGTSRTTAGVENTAKLTLAGGDLAIKAQGSSEHVATAQPKEVSGVKTGVGAGVALNLADETTLAQIQGAAIVAGAAKVDVVADSKNKLTTTAESGAAGSNAWAPAIAVTLATLDTTADVGGGGTLAATGAL